MTVNGVTSSHVGAYSAWVELRAYRDQLAADLAANASPQVIAADRAHLTQSAQRMNISARRVNVLV